MWAPVMMTTWSGVTKRRLRQLNCSQKSVFRYRIKCHYSLLLIEKARRPQSCNYILDQSEIAKQSAIKQHQLLRQSKAILHNLHPLWNKDTSAAREGVMYVLIGQT